MNASDVDMAYRDWLKQGLNRQGYDNTGLAAAWGLERTAVSKVLSGVRRLLVVNAFQAYDYLGVHPPGVTVVSRPEDQDIDLLYGRWFAENFDRKGQKAELARLWGTDRATVSKAASGRRPLTMVEAILAARMFKSNPPGLELDRMPVSGPRLAEKLAAGVGRSPTAHEDTPYQIEPDPDYPHADLRVYQVDGPGMDGRKLRPIIPGDLVAAVLLKDIKGSKKAAIPDGSLVVVKQQVAQNMYEWTLRTVKWEGGGIILSCETAKRMKIPPLHLASLSEGGSVKVIALARRVISKL
jgi:hypothetical protein